MLDDQNLIKQRDPQDALAVVAGQWQQLTKQYEVSFSPTAEIDNIVLGGMGGSAWPALFLQAWPGVSLPFETVRNYELPSYVGERTLYIASSYSGNTEEALAMLVEAEKRGALIVVMTAGGKLMQHAEEKDYPLFAIPTGTEPRMSSLYFWVGLVQLLEPLGIVPAQSKQALASQADWLKGQMAQWLPTVAAAQNRAKQIAQELMGKTAIIYSGPKLFPAVNKWKICLNENAKNLAWCNQYPEFNHNEFIGWTSHPVQKLFGIVEIRSSLEHPRLQRRFVESERLLSGKRPRPIVVEPKGDDLLQQLLWCMALGDFVSIYLAILNGVNPTPVELVEKLKEALGT